MARTVRDANLETRAARARLKACEEPCRRAIDPGAHPGYYRGGSWIARRFKEPGHDQARLGIADDGTDADGLAVLDFRRGQAKARPWFAEQACRAEGLGPTPADPYMVADAVRDYLAWYADRKKGRRQSTKAAISHILPALGEIEVAKLTTAAIERWRMTVAKAPARVRSPASGRRARSIEPRVPTPPRASASGGSRQIAS